MKKIKQLVGDYKARLETRRKCRLVAESTHRIQVMEFCGILHICFDGIPLIEEGWLKDDVGLAARLEDVRGTYRLYQLDEAI